VHVYAVCRQLHLDAVYVIRHGSAGPHYPLLGREVMAYLQPLFSPAVALGRWSEESAETHPVVRDVLAMASGTGMTYTTPRLIISTPSEVSCSAAQGMRRSAATQDARITRWNVEVSRHCIIRLVNRAYRPERYVWDVERLPFSVQCECIDTECVSRLLDRAYRYLVRMNRTTRQLFIRRGAASLQDGVECSERNYDAVLSAVNDLLEGVCTLPPLLDA
jgi:hypothetical protein